MHPSSPDIGWRWTQGLKNANWLLGDDFCSKGTGTSEVSCKKGQVKCILSCKPHIVRLIAFVSRFFASMFSRHFESASGFCSQQEGQSSLTNSAERLYSVTSSPNTYSTVALMAVVAAGWVKVRWTFGEDIRKGVKRKKNARPACPLDEGSCCIGDTDHCDSDIAFPALSTFSLRLLHSHR